MATNLKRFHLAGAASNLASLLGRFKRDTSGTIGLLFAVTCMVVMSLVAIAIDYGRAEQEQSRMQRAADAAALAASHRLGRPDQDASGLDVATRFFNANTDNRPNEAMESITLDAATGEVKVLAGGTVFTSLLNAVGINSLDVRVGSRVVKGDGTVEVALVLDNSGSMAGQPIADLTTAAQNLSNVLFTGVVQSDRVKLAVVPFAGAVNVGPLNADMSWIDRTGISPLNGANFATNTPRLDLFNQLGTPWAGCVEARPSPNDVTDQPASAATPATLFVPMFAPDEPDKNNDDGNSYYNSYLADDGGACTPQPRVCLSYSRRGNCQKWQTTPLPAAEAQARMCKYQYASVSSGSAGPNYMCDSQPLLPLTTSQTEVNDRLATLTAKGSTNIAEGVAWGWRVLSPGAPFPEGRPYETADNRKIIVLMTDGANTYSSYSNHNRSWYGAQGYGAAGRLGNSYASSAYVNQMNQKTLAVCANAKAAGVTIYTIAFRLENDPATQALLQSCATEASKAFSASDGNALISAFERIGTEISNLRVAG